MKEQDNNLTLQEIEQLCRLYMDCRLSVLEETELRYVLGKLPYSSPCIDDVRMLMGLRIPSEACKAKNKRFGFLRNAPAIGIAASIAVTFAIAAALFAVNEFSTDNADVYIAAYSHGKRLNESEAVAATNNAIAKADSLMAFASHTEHDYMMKADNIISATANN